VLTKQILGALTTNQSNVQNENLLSITKIMPDRFLKLFNLVIISGNKSEIIFSYLRCVPIVAAATRKFEVGKLNMHLHTNMH